MKFNGSYGRTLLSMSGSGGHLGFPIGKKPEFCRGPSNDHSWEVWLNCPSGFREEVI
jgi:hypothetical protein